MLKEDFMEFCNHRIIKSLRLEHVISFTILMNFYPWFMAREIGTEKTNSPWEIKIFYTLEEEDLKQVKQQTCPHLIFHNTCGTTVSNLEEMANNSSRLQRGVLPYTNKKRREMHFFSDFLPLGI